MYHIAVFASGNGSTLQSIIDAIKQKDLDIKIDILVASSPNAYVLQRAKEGNIDTYIINAKTTDQVDIDLINVLDKYDIDLIVLAGYLRLIGKRIIGKYKIINTHPSLLPKYGGKGMYGDNVHKAVIEAKEKKTGVTVHYVNESYDKGNIICQTEVEVKSNDNYESLAKRVQKAEKIQLIQVLKDLSNNR